MLSGWKTGAGNGLGTAGCCPTRGSRILDVDHRVPDPRKMDLMNLHDLAMSKSPRAYDYSQFVLFIRSKGLWDFSKHSSHILASAPPKRRG